MYGMKAAFKFIVNEVIFEKSYIELNDDTKAFGSYLQKVYGKQNKIGLIGRTSYEWIVTYLGITRSQNIAVTLDYSLNVDALCEQIDFADVNLMFLSGEFEAYKDRIYEKCKKVKKIFTFDLASDMFYANYGLEEDFDETTVAQLIFTSGTTSKSKAVVLTHQNLMVVFEKTPGYTVNSRFRSLSLLPLHHITELAFGVFHPLKSGTTICINDNIQKLMENMQVFKPHFMTVVPEILNKFAKIAQMYLEGVDISKVRAMTMDERRKAFQQFNRDIFGGHLRYLNIGGAKADVEAMNMIELMGIYAVEGYASTEMSGCCVCNMAGFTKVGTCGKVHFEGTEIKLVEKELCVKGTNIMKEYYKNPEATKNAFTEDGYFKTGDLAEFDEDNNVVITGRKNDLIVLNNGENVSPEALQSLIYKNEKVDKCVVYGYKNQLCVIIYVKEKTDSLCEEITQHIHNINNTLPNYKKIVDILFTTTPFDVTPKGSIKRNLVIARAISMHEEKAFVEAKTETEIKICNRVMELLHLKEKNQYY